MSNLVINTTDFGGYKKFNSIIKKILPFVYPTESRYDINGIYFEFKEDQTILTATDGHSLYTEFFNIKNKVIGNTIIKLEGLKQLIKIKQEYFFEIDGEQFVKLNGHNYSWIINADYIKYNDIIPSLKENSTAIGYTKEDLKHKLLKEANIRMREALNEEEIKLITNYLKQKNLLMIDFNEILKYINLQDNKGLSILSKEKIKILESNKKFIEKRINSLWYHKSTTIVVEEFYYNFNISYINDIMDALDNKNIIFNINSNTHKSSALFCENNKRILLMADRF
tara:strand:- start:507 stop:1352 length:846 start_codon:yes stop_codon:yes gene_type:complete